MFATQVLPETPSNDSEEDHIAEIVGLIIVDDKKYELKRGETKLGRDPSMCSVVIENFTVSKVHAVIESEGVNDSFIYDVGSTNQTKLGKKILKPHCRYKLDNNSILTLGNVTVKFILPPDKNSGPDSQSSQPVNLDDFGDIFDLPTQVGVLQSNSPNEVLEKKAENHHISKTPSLYPEKTGSEIRINEPLQWRANAQKAKLQTVYCTSPLENSHIFSIGTQCQIYDPPSEQNNSAVQTVPSVDDKNKNSESEKITSLLNDGQDDVLCTFMSLHSPKEQTGFLKEINIKTENESFSQVLDAPTPAQAETSQERERKALSELLGNKDIVQEFCDQISYQPTVTSTPVSSRVNSNHPKTDSEKNDNSIEHTDENFIRTQEFNVIQSESNQERQGDSPAGPSNLPQNEETQPYLMDDFRELPTGEPENGDEDFIFTQTFERTEKDPQNDETSVVIPETEDFLETQIFPVENEMRLEARGGSTKSPSRDIESTLNFTQRSDEDDFIATQAFEKPNDVRSPGERSDRNESDDNEDFIATQKIQLPAKMSFPKNCPRATTPTTALRGSSPDLLASETPAEDFISTQIFDVDSANPAIKIGEQISSRSKENDDCNIAQTKVPDPVESSGDETDSDLEIILDRTETTTGKERSQKLVKTERCESNPRVFSEAEGNDDSNSSYIFELGADDNTERVVPQDLKENRGSAAHLSDSDSTDCEEIAVIRSKMPVKEEPKERRVEFDETQVLTLTLPNDFAELPSGSNNDWTTDPESPKFDASSPLSLEMPNTQEIETTMKRILEKEKPVEEENEDFVRPSKIKKTEVGTNSSRSRDVPESPIDSAIKRPLDSNNAEVVPLKKFKTEVLTRLLRSSEKQLLKLVQVHDIAHIQPGRTRNSLKGLTTETKREVSPRNNVNNEYLPTSRRKASPKTGRTRNQNGEISPQLTRKAGKKLSSGGRKTEIFPSENQSVEGSTRVLRSSRRSETKSPEKTIRRSRRHSGKNDDYFGGSCVDVVFTGFHDCQNLEKIISDLGGRKTNDLASGKVVVADKVRRTVKFLSAMGLSLPIASPQWLLSCRAEKKFLNPWNFILKDQESEKRWGFELKASLERSKKAKLLKGFSVFATESTKPPVKDLLAIVECCGGTPLFELADVWPKKTIIVSCLEDEKWWPPPKLRNIKIVHYEFILSGVLRQKIDFKTYKLR